MTESHVAPQGAGGAVGFGLLWHALRTRVAWVAAGVVIGLVAAGAYLVATPRLYHATTAVNITAVSEEPLVKGNAASKLIDFSTEKQLAASAETAARAAKALGAGWSTEDLRDVTVGGDAEGTVLTLSYAAADPERAEQGADALAQAYLEQRVSLAMARVEATRASIKESIKAAQEELKTTPVDSSQFAALRDRVASLAHKETELSYVTDDAGQIITHAGDGEVYATPARARTLLLGLLGGLVLGVVLALVAFGLARRLRTASDVERELGVPVWRAAGELGADGRWELAAQRAAFAVSDAPAVVITDGTGADAAAAADALAGVLSPRLIDAADPRGALVAAARGWGQDSGQNSAPAPVAVLVGPYAWPKKELSALVEDLEAVGVRVAGLVRTEAS